jgi:hypothetical protein
MPKTDQYRAGFTFIRQKTKALCEIQSRVLHNGTVHYRIYDTRDRYTLFLPLRGLQAMMGLIQRTPRHKRK